MKQFDFTNNGIQSFMSNVENECKMKISSTLQEINNSPIIMKDEQLERFKEVYNSLSIKIIIGDNTIEIPHHAYNVETIFNAVKVCKEQTK